MTGNSKPRKILAPTLGDATTGIDMKVLLRADQTDGELALFEETTAPNFGPPLHVHYDADEFFRIIDGTYRFRAGDETIDASAGDSLFVPRGTPHCFCNVGTELGRLFMGFTPGGGETFFDWIAQNGMPEGSEEQAAMLRERYHIEFLGPNPFVQ